MILCCPDKFRGSLSAEEAAAAICRGVVRAGLDARALPLADGGEGTLDALLGSLPGMRLTATVTGPDGRPVEAEWAALENGIAIVEMARASGLALVERNDPLRATTFGTGELIAAALDHGCRRIIVGVGGSATVDGGLGALDALSWSLRGAEVLVACDVMTFFLDAPALFGPQKGASAAEIGLLEGRLAAFAERLLATQALDVRELPGSGAAGGLGGGLAAIGARLVPGFDVVADAVGFPAALAASSGVITGEGRVDLSTMSGKVVGRVLAAAHSGFRPAAVVAGAIAPGLDLGVPAQALAEMGSDDPFGAAAVLAEEAACLLAQRLCARA